MDPRYSARRELSTSYGRDDTVTATLLIPEPLFNKLYHHLIGDHTCGFSSYLRILVNNYKLFTYEAALPASHKVNCQYQEPGQNLVRQDIRVETQIWVEFGLIARSLGISRCLLFVILAKIEMVTYPYRLPGVPTSRWQRYDRNNPRFLEYRERFYKSRRKFERVLRTRPLPERQLPTEHRMDKIREKDPTAFIMKC